ncbi:MAG: oleate hydratase [Pseudomonadales bacterium]
MSPQEGTEVYLLGGGIASLAAAVYLIRDAQVPGRNIHILSEERLGGSLDASGSSELGYSMRGSRMFGAAYVHTYDLLAQIPSLDEPDISVLDDTLDFWKSTPWHAKARLIDNGEVADLSSWGLSDKDRLDLLRLMLFAENLLGAKRIDECFAAHFFTTNFWMLWASMFGFETWHSAAELRRYLLRLLRFFPDLETLKLIVSTRYNGYDSIVRPLVKWLQHHGVQAETDVQVLDLDFAAGNEGKRVRRIACLRHGKLDSIEIEDTDLVIATLGSMTADSSLGSMTQAPVLKTEKTNGCWAFWQRLAEKDREFGNPLSFCGHIDQTKWVTFTVTDSGDAFAHRMEQLSSSKPGRGGLVTVKNSSWRLTFHLYHPPAYPDQPEGVFVWWGYGLLPDQTGDYVNKKMSECNGTEILVEVFSHLRFQRDTPTFLKTANCIPCMLPYTTSQFMPRPHGSRPAVVPKGTVNLAFVGQYCEIPDDIAYTIEYSIHSAYLAVTALLGIPNNMPPTYKGLEHPYALVSALKRILN